MKIFVVPATYNEKDNIGRFITLLEEEIFPKIKNHEMHILVADDNSPDGTGDIVKSLMKKYKNLGINQGEKKGLGAAYIRTMGEAIDKMNADAVISVDADFQHDLNKIPQFVKKLEEGYDMVIGTRYSGGGSIPQNWPPQRKLFSIVANLFVRSVFMKFDIHDWTGGFRAISKKVFIKERPEMVGFNGYIFQIAFLNKVVRDGFTVSEVPFHFSDRTMGSSKIAPLAYIIDVVRFVITTRIKELSTGIFAKFLVVGGAGFIINFLILKILSDNFRWDHALANLVGAVVAIFSNFNLNNLWTFKHHKISGVSAYIWKLLHFYAASIFGVIFIQTGTIFLGDKLIGEGQINLFVSLKFYYIYFVLGTGFLLIWNFFIYNRFIWKKKK